MTVSGELTGGTEFLQRQHCTGSYCYRYKKVTNDEIEAANCLKDKETPRASPSLLNRTLVPGDVTRRQVRIQL